MPALHWAITQVRIGDDEQRRADGGQAEVSRMAAGPWTSFGFEDSGLKVQASPVTVL